ncbi:MAG: hypothetical protein P3T54_00880 [Dehalogenimonas sp.]|uniref:NERD domain-containing protein n=1 Tax=Candidatus Dehalogenimonas loeffleri TaxID=3127115 RepID=A0ABZ2J0Y9_9CHLR|nr:hypothetical protein [Dehalogenimonas sp.]
MLEESKDFHDKLKVMNQKAHSDAEAYFRELTKLVGALDPVKLLSQLTLTFGTVPEDQFNDESSDVHEWARWLGFVSGYLLTRPYPANARKEVDGRDIKGIEDLLKQYFISISQSLISDAPKSETGEVDEVVSLAKNDSFFVRGESYPHQLKEMAYDIWTEHDEWFVKSLGFTINDALTISEAIKEECNRRINDEKESCKVRAHQNVDELIKRGEAKEHDRKNLEASMGCYYYFGNSDAILSFTLDEMASFSGFPKDRCERYLKRLSQGFGYRNKNHLDTFNDPHLAPWDYNTIYERPIVCHAEKYFIPVPSVLNEVLLHTFFYDMIADSNYWKKNGEKKYGKCLEQKTAELLRRVFPPREVLLNPKYPGGNELCDVLVLHDRNVFIVQCKTKRLRYESKIGKDSQLIKDDLNKAVAESFEQGSRARKYLSNNQPTKIQIENGIIEIDSKQISKLFLLSVTLGSYPHLITRLANINKTLNLFSDNQYPWAVSLFDLGVLTDLIESPSSFVHYAMRRMAMERTRFDIFGDEIDMLGYYFSQGLVFETEQYKKTNALLLNGFSDNIDLYMFEKHELGRNPQKPVMTVPPKFWEYVRSIEELKSPYKTDCAVRLLDCDYRLKEAIVQASEKIRGQTKSDGLLHTLSMAKEDQSVGFSFTTMHVESLEELYRKVLTFSSMKKYVTRCKEWVGLGWNKNSGKEVDVAVFLSFDWQEDSVIAKLAAENLKPGEMLNPEG